MKKVYIIVNKNRTGAEAIVKVFGGQIPAINYLKALEENAKKEMLAPCWEIRQYYLEKRK